MDRDKFWLLGLTLPGIPGCSQTKVQQVYDQGCVPARAYRGCDLNQEGKAVISTSGYYSQFHQGNNETVRVFYETFGHLFYLSKYLFN